MRGQLPPKTPPAPCNSFPCLPCLPCCPKPQPQALTALKPHRRKTQKDRTRAKARATMKSHSFVHPQQHPCPTLRTRTPSSSPPQAPLAPNGGEGSGVRGQLPPKHQLPPAIPFRVFRVFRGAPKPQPLALTALKPSRRETQKDRTRAKARATMTSRSFVPIRVHSWFKTAPAPHRRYPLRIACSSRKMLPQECSAPAESVGPTGVFREFDGLYFGLPVAHKIAFGKNSHTTYPAWQTAGPVQGGRRTGQGED